MADRPDTPDDDANLFRELMGDVTPLPPDNRIERNSTPRSTHPRNSGARQDAGHFADDHGLIQSDYVPPVKPDESLFFNHPGLQEKVRKRLRTGKIPLEARLDLHGKTIVQAAGQLDAFLRQAQQDQMRCVLVIHGRGYRSQDNQPVLKAQVNHWLREHPAVLAFASAQPQHGGVGAVYVLLRKVPLSKEPLSKEPKSRC